MGAVIVKGWKLARFLAERLVVPGSVVAVIGVLRGLQKGSVFFGFSVVTIAFCLLAMPVLLYTAIKQDALNAKRPHATVHGVIGGLCALGLGALVFWEASERTLSEFNNYAVAGMVFTAGIVAGTVLAVWRRYRDTHKECPECLNTVDDRVRVCEHCGYRWMPPLPERY